MPYIFLDRTAPVVARQKARCGSPRTFLKVGWRETIYLRHKSEDADPENGLQRSICAAKIKDHARQLWVLAGCHSLPDENATTGRLRDGASKRPEMGFWRAFEEAGVWSGYARIAAINGRTPTTRTRLSSSSQFPGTQETTCSVGDPFPQRNAASDPSQIAMQAQNHIAAITSSAAFPRSQGHSLHMRSRIEVLGCLFGP